MKNWKKSLLFLCCLVLLSSIVFTSQNVTEANYSVPSISAYEVKVFLDPDAVLTKKQNLAKQIRDEFSTGSSAKQYNVQFLDTPQQALKNEGWSIRLRKQEDQGQHRIQYKKRYPIINGDVQTALQTAFNDGFDANSIFEAEVDWGYTNQTLSFQVQEKVKLSNYSGLQLPNLADSKTVAHNFARDEFSNWISNGWGASQINASKIYGPVYFQRYTGEFEGEELAIEIWHVRNEAGTGMEYLVEASFKAEDFTTASEKRANLIQLLDTKGWLLPQDVLKTQMILDRY